MIVSPQQTLYTPSGNPEHGFAGDGSNVLMAYCDGAGNIVVIKSTDEGSSWSAPITVDTNANNVDVMLNEPFTFDKINSRYHLVWGRQTGVGGSPCQLMYSHSDDTGATWSTAVMIDDGTVHGNNRFYRVGVGAYKGVVAVLYNSLSSSTFTGDGMWMVQSINGGGTFSSPAKLYSTGAGTEDPHEENVIIGDDGTIHACHYNDPTLSNKGGDVYYAQGLWTASGFTWQASLSRLTTGQSCGRTRISASRGVVMITMNTNWNASPALADIGTLRSTDNGATWGGSVTQATHVGSNNTSHPWLHLDGHKGALVWSQIGAPSVSTMGLLLTNDGGATFTAGPTPFVYTTFTDSDAPILYGGNNLLLIVGTPDGARYDYTRLPLWAPDPAVTTSGQVIDNFNRANENPLSDSGKWSQQTGDAAALQIVSNAILKTGTGTFARAGSQRNDRVYTEAEVFVSLGASGYGTDGRLTLDLWNESTNDKYSAAIQENGVFINFFNAGVFGGNISDSTIVATTGDKYVLRVTPRHVVLLRFVNAQSDWQEVLRLANTSFRTNLSGVLELSCVNDSPTVDDYGGSALVVPSNSVAPTASGTVSMGNTISIANGTWTTTQGSTPTRYSYQWQSSPAGTNTWTNISLAALSFLVVNDITKDYRCVVTASNSYGNTSVNSNVLTTTPTVTVSPTGLAATTGLGTFAIEVDLTVIGVQGYGLVTGLGSVNVNITTPSSDTVTPLGMAANTALGTPKVAIDTILISPIGFGATTRLGSVLVQSTSTTGKGKRRRSIGIGIGIGDRHV